jgi:hypothetical protein
MSVWRLQIFHLLLRIQTGLSMFDDVAAATNLATLPNTVSLTMNAILYDLMAAYQLIVQVVIIIWFPHHPLALEDTDQS